MSDASGLDMDSDSNEDENVEFVARIVRLEADVAKLERVTKGILETLAWGALAAPLAFFVVKFDRPRGLWWPHLFDTAHVMLSALMALIALRLSRRVLAGVFRGPMPHYLVAATVVAAAGGGIEVVQIVIAGDPSIADFIRDLGGALAALIFALSVDRYGGRGSGAASVRRWGLRAAAVALFCLALVPTVKGLSALAFRRGMFPTLANFEASWARRFVEASGGAVLTLQAAPPDFTRARGQVVAKVRFEKGANPGLELSGLFGDWSSYSSLVFEAYSPEASPVPLELRVHDRHHRNRYDDRFNTSLRIAPGQTTVSISLEDIRNGPTGRQMDMANIRGIILFMIAPPRPMTLYFDNLRLERGGSGPQSAIE